MDDVYLISIWVDRGQDSFLAAMESESVAVGLELESVMCHSSEPDPVPILDLIIERGQNIDEVRHLL